MRDTQHAYGFVITVIVGKKERFNDDSMVK